MNITDILCNYIKNPEIYKFLVVGIGGAISTLSLTIFFTSILGIFYVISVPLALELTIVWNFFVHDRWTFAAVPKTMSMKKKFIKSNVVALFGIGINEFILILLTTKIGFHYEISEIIAIIVTFFFNYTAQKKISWKN